MTVDCRILTANCRVLHKICQNEITSLAVHSESGEAGSPSSGLGEIGCIDCTFSRSSEMGCVDCCSDMVGGSNGAVASSVDGFSSFVKIDK